MYTSVFLLNIIYFSVCLTSNKLYWIEDQLADVSTRFYTSASWSIGELTVIQFRWVHFTFLVYFFGVFLFLDCFPLFGILLNE